MKVCHSICNFTNTTRDSRRLFWILLHFNVHDSCDVLYYFILWDRFNYVQYFIAPHSPTKASSEIAELNNNNIVSRNLYNKHIRGDRPGQNISLTSLSFCFLCGWPDAYEKSTSGISSVVLLWSCFSVTWCVPYIAPDTKKQNTLIIPGAITSLSRSLISL